MRKALLEFFLIFLASPVFALSGVTVQGRLLRSDSSPVTSPQLQFKIQIRSPGNENCLLYEETQIKDLSSSDGNFSFIVQDALETSRVRTDTTGLPLEKIFANRVVFTGLSCGIGTSYTPSATDGRVLQVLFREDVSSAWEPMPAQRVSAVPVALQALQIEGYTSSQLLRVADGSTLTELSASDATNLSGLIAGTSVSFVKPADLPACNTNEYLTKSGSTVSCAPVSGSSGGTVTSVATGAGLTGGPIVSTGTISLANVASNTLLGNSTGSAAAPSATSLTAMMDASFGNAQGNILYRDASGWTVLAPGTSGYFLKTQGASANPVWASASSGSVSSVDLTAPSIFSVAGTPITSSGTIALSLANQSANTVFAGPASGGAAAPSFRALNIPDLRSSVAGAFLTGSGCTAGQGLVYSSVNDNISCQDIAISSSQVTTGLGYTPVNKAGDTMSGALNLPSNGLAVGTNQLVVASGSIGIGTATPAALLDVRGGAVASSAKGVSLVAQSVQAGGSGVGGSVILTAGSAAAPSGGAGNVNISAGTSTTTLGPPGNVNISGGDTSTSVNGGNVVISGGASTGTGGNISLMPGVGGTASGKVGIGTTSPTHSLHISDLANASIYVEDTSNGRISLNPSGGTSFIPSAATASAFTIYNEVLNQDPVFRVSTVSSPGNSAVTVFGDFDVKTYSNGKTSLQIVASTGNVGIGTTSPQASLDVAGTAAVQASVEGIANSVNSGSAYTVPNASLNIRRITATADATITLPASTTPTASVYTLTIFIKQDGSGGHAISFAGNGSDTVKWDGGVAPAIATTAGKTTILQFTKPSDEGIWYASMTWRED